jgi:hypothetical protein
MDGLLNCGSRDGDCTDDLKKKLVNICVWLKGRLKQLIPVWGLQSWGSASATASAVACFASLTSLSATSGLVELPL